MSLAFVKHIPTDRQVEHTIKTCTFTQPVSGMLMITAYSI